MKKEVIIPKGGAKPLAPYSPGIRVGNLLYTSGQIGLDPETGNLIGGGVKAETRQALLNLEKILEAGGSSIRQVIKVTVYIREIDDYRLVNEVYAKFFKEDPPARAVVEGKLPAGASVEFDAVAIATANATAKAA